MTNHAELIAEAEKVQRVIEDAMCCLRRETPEYGTHEDVVTDVLQRLRAADTAMVSIAAALRECAVPAGWRVTEYIKGTAWDVDAPRVFLSPEWGWIAVKDENEHSREHPTASAAMAALDGEGD